MTDDMTIGQRVAFYRRRRGLSQEVLAGLVGRTAEWLRKVENSRADLDRLSVIQSVATALDVSIGDLIGEPTLFEWSGDSGLNTVPALRAALRDYRHLSPIIAGEEMTECPPLGELEREVVDAWDAYQQSRYSELTKRLPGLIDRCLRTARTLRGDSGRRANALAAYSHHVATLFLTKLGETDLAWIAASRGLTAATTSDDPVVVASLSRAVAHALTSNGEYSQAREVALATAQYLEPYLKRPSPSLISVFGTLQLMCGLAAARADDRSSAHAHIAVAREYAQRLGRDANHVWTAFGPTNVLIHETCVALELGDVQRAIRIGPAIDTRALPIERRVRHSMEVARALVRWNRVDEAMDSLVEAERISPEQIRYHRLSRILVRDLLAKPRPPIAAIELAQRMGVHRREPS